jgi:hypothetical protein
MIGATTPEPARLMRGSAPSVFCRQCRKLIVPAFAKNDAIVSLEASADGVLVLVEQTPGCPVAVVAQQGWAQAQRYQVHECQPEAERTMGTAAPQRQRAQGSDMQQEQDQKPGQRLATIERKDGAEQLRVEMRNFNNYDFVDIRCFFKDEHGELRPGKGCTIKIRELVAVRDALTEAITLSKDGQSARK